MISIIVPVYKVEDYLPRCIESILSQSYSDFELLLIDDGSPDRCGEICDNYARRDLRIKVMHKKNGGLSDARNYGMDRMTGDYVTFIDSDDYIGPDYLKSLLDMITKEQADISVVACEMSSSWKIDWEPWLDQSKYVVMNSEEVIRNIMTRGGIPVCAWGKLYKADQMKNTRFPYGKIYEDLHVIPYLLADSDKIVYSAQAQYCYFQRDSSIMNKGPASKRQIEDYLEGQEKLLSFTKAVYPQFNQMAQRRFISGIFSTVIDWIVIDPQYRPMARQIKKQFRQCFRHGIINPELNLTERMKVILFHCNVSLYRFARLAWPRFIKKRAV